MRWLRCCWRLCCRCFLAACHVSCQRRLQAALRSVSMGLTLCRVQRMPAPYATCFHDHLIGTFHAARANGPACGLIGRVVHVHLTLVQISQFLLDSGTGIARGQPGQVLEHALGSLMFESVEHSLKPRGWQSASGGLHGLADPTCVFSSMGKV